MKVKGPLMSYRCKGSFDCITFKDINLEGDKHMTVAHLKQKRKKKVTPDKNKESFKEAVSIWHDLIPDEIELWNQLEYEKPVSGPEKIWQADLTGYHKMISINVKRKLTGKEMIRVPD